MRLWWYLVLLPCVARGASVDLPAEVAGDPGSFLRVPAKTDCAELRWVALDPGLNLFPTELLKDSRTAVVAASKPGRYRLLAYGARDNRASEPAICVVVIGEVPVPPVPPVPPSPPVPPVPPPEDELTRQLRVAYRDCTGINKASELAELARIYRRTAEVEILREEFKTALELFLRMQELRRATLPEDALAPLRRIIEKELNQRLPMHASTPLDMSLRRKAAQVFQEIATRLEALP